jgi:hypothetical protein
LLRIELLAAEPSHKFLGMLGVREAIDIPPLALVKDRVTAGAQRQVIAERPNGIVTTVEQYRGRQRDLVRPSAVYPGGGKLPFTYTMPNCVNVHEAASISRAMDPDWPASV